MVLNFGVMSYTHISELDLSYFTQGTHHLPTDFICDIKLGQAHIRRAEECIFRSHIEEDCWPREPEEL